MERLTCIHEELFALRDLCTFDKKQQSIDCVSCAACCEEKIIGDCVLCPIQKAFDKLAEYEDAEEQGLLIHLQCKVGDYVYQIDRMNNKINTNKVAKITITLGKESCIMHFDFETTGSCRYEDFGKTVFMNKVEAANALNAKTEVKK